MDKCFAFCSTEMKFVGTQRTDLPTKHTHPSTEIRLATYHPILMYILLLKQDGRQHYFCTTQHLLNQTRQYPPLGTLSSGPAAIIIINEPGLPIT